MGWTIALSLLGLLVIFLAVLIVRALLYKPKAEQERFSEPVSVDREKVVRDMQQMLRCRTVSYNDETLVDQAEFQKFRKLLPQLYPHIHQTCERIFLGVEWDLISLERKAARGSDGS